MFEDENQKFYFSVVENDEKVSFFKKAATDNLDVEVWQKGQKKSEVELFQVKSYDPDSHQLNLKFKGTLLTKITGSKNRDQDILLKISFESIYIFTSTHIKYNVSKDLYYCDISNEIYKSQQRTNYRLNANRFIKIKFKILGEVFDALDISAGGTSFIIPANIVDKFPKDQELQDCVVRIANRNYPIHLIKIAGIWEHEIKDGKNLSSKGYKIGISFLDIDKKVEEDLFLSINTEARGEEIRKKSSQSS